MRVSGNQDDTFEFVHGSISWVLKNNYMVFYSRAQTYAALLRNSSVRLLMFSFSSEEVDIVYLRCSLRSAFDERERERERVDVVPVLGAS